jgi:hypothetical protein
MSDSTAAPGLVPGGREGKRENVGQAHEPQRIGRVRIVVAFFVMLLASSACPIVDDELPGAPCSDDDDCPASFACIEDVCVPGDAIDNEPIVGCDGAADGDDCSDGDPCTENDACTEGACIGAALECDVNEACSGGVCIDLGECTLAGVAERVTNTPGVSASASLAYDGERNQIAVAFDDDVTGLSEIYVQLLDGDTASPIGAAVQVTDGVAQTKNDTDRASFQPQIVYSAEQDEYALAWTSLGGDIIGVSVNAFAVTLTSSLVPATIHDVLKSGLSPVFSVGAIALASTGAGYGAAWVDDRNSSDTVDAFDVSSPVWKTTPSPSLSPTSRSRPVTSSAATSRSRSIRARRTLRRRIAWSARRARCSSRSRTSTATPRATSSSRHRATRSSPPSR